MFAGEYLTLSSHDNQARGIAHYAIEFLSRDTDEIDAAVFAKIEQFHRDSVACAISALGLRVRAPTVLREEALCYRCPNPTEGVPCFGSTDCVFPEKAVAANSSAVREWDANGTNFGYNPVTGNTRGEFGHNDFYPVAIAAAQLAGLTGRQTLRAMICLDEIRGRLAESFALRDYKIDHVVHGAIASATVYGAVLGATVDQIESAIGMVVAHYIPFRAIRAGNQLSDSKGASAALSAEVAVMSMRRAMRGFVGPVDIFRNPQAIFCLFEPSDEPELSPFNLRLTLRGSDYAVMGMHFKIGLYEHQSAGAIEGLIDVLSANPGLLRDVQQIERIQIAIYEPAFSIIGDPAKRNPKTRQSADHSMVYIVATLLRKALQSKTSDWESLMLMPSDYDDSCLSDSLTHSLMDRIDFVHGGAKYDEKYPDGIPTKLDLCHTTLGVCSSGLVMYPEGHARNTSGNLERLLNTKFRQLAAHGVASVTNLEARLTNMLEKTPEEIRTLFDFEIIHK